MAEDKEIYLLHFNDVYEITESSKEPIGGASRFYSKVKELKEEFSPLVVFSGDAFSPSVTSSITGGTHMVPILNEIGIHAACIGNHDFDFGVESCTELTGKTNFAPWMMANVVDADGNFLSNATDSMLIDWNGIKVGLIGLVEQEWMETVTCFPDGIKYLDQVQVGTEIAQQLREKGAELIIAVTHSRADNDKYLALNAKGIDIILGGHDHHYYIHYINGIPILNSGSNFKQLSLIKVTLNTCKNTSNIKDLHDIANKDIKQWNLQGYNASFDIKRFDITSSINPDLVMSKIVNSVSEIMEKLKQKPLGHTESIWDARAEVVRTQESGVGNFVADLMKEYYACDMALLQGGCIRSNDTYGPGKLTMGDAMKMFPFIDCTVVFEIKGKYIREALENGFSQWPKHEGRFPQLAGCWVEVDMSKEPGNRVLKIEMGSKDNKELLDDKRLYTVASKGYTMNGGDGFTSFLNKTRVLVDEENGMTSANLLRNEFLINKVSYALQRQKRVDNIVCEALNAFKSTLSPDTNRIDCSSPINNKCINVNTEGRINIIQ